jgi:hypothetical protein
MALGFRQVVRGRTRGGASPYGGLHPRPPTSHRAKAERTGAPDRSHHRSGERWKRLGYEKAGLRGTNGSAMQPNMGMRVLPSAQNTMA